MTEGHCVHGGGDEISSFRQRRKAKLLAKVIRLGNVVQIASVCRIWVGAKYR
jgi:hypothetical protein